ncbi:M48 family metalloprotease [Salinarimonas rosea]|uniref:M48 family metalloprotease n=1 Tax=Salinarimonas rosea TaxID=552063 RepID=UPI00048F02A0|nr:M48 family metalloprotease [Salinarimonas rosea]
MTRASILVRLAVLGAAAVGLSGCNPIFGGDPRPPAQAPALTGVDSEHEQLVASFGGEYRAPQAQALLESMTAKLVAATDRPDAHYRVTILDSPAINAFALPTGRLYVTRGLIALANDASELAAVMAHEIAHVTLAHAAARSELEARSVLVSRVVSDVLRDQRASADIRETSRYDFARFSRAQELESDAVSVRTLARAGFDPFGAARFLTALDRWVALSDGMQGGGPPSRLATHPSTPERIAEARNAARRIGAPGLGAGDRDAYLAAIDGIAFGEDPRDGIVRGPRYLNARLGIGFTAPDGFTLDNASRAVLGTSADGERRLMFDAVEPAAGQGLADVVRATWTDSVVTGAVEEREVNGLPAAVASSRGDEWLFRVAAVRAGGAVYRLIFAYRPADAGAEAAFQRTLGTVRRIGEAEIAALTRLRVRVVTAGAGDTLETLAARMQVERPVETFRALNGLFEHTRIEPGRTYKIVAG